ncbi:hypothetical protein JYU34_019451 [Plutella xylostella]|uniref:Uncharacterized protein n=1 Tax=Plutella xylostella TaxID=51655 RepID=A0ABQ7PX41_PLUXY|nr:hypothetical protein JYU34_019451 [Plutella xylostella]
MAKFIKSFFNGQRRASKQDIDEDFTPPLDSRRKLSISRSGRMKQANKKRHSLSLELYGDNHQREKPAAKEYHVHGKSYTDNSNLEKQKTDPKTAKKNEPSDKGNSEQIKTPEEEIDSAFEILDKT